MPAFCQVVLIFTHFSVYSVPLHSPFTPSSTSLFFVTLSFYYLHIFRFLMFCFSYILVSPGHVLLLRNSSAIPLIFYSISAVPSPLSQACHMSSLPAVTLSFHHPVPVLIMPYVPHHVAEPKWLEIHYGMNITIFLVSNAYSTANYGYSP